MGFYRGPNIVTNGLVLNLDAANVKSYPGSGTTWRDLSGNNNTGTLINGPIFTNSEGGGLIFDGVDDYVSTNLVTVGTNNTTNILWYKWNGVNQARVLTYIGLTSTNGMGFYINNGTNSGTDGNRVSVLYGGSFFNAINVGTTGTLIANTYTQLVLSRDTATTRLYQNGTLIGSTTSTPLQNSSNMNFSFGGTLFAAGTAAIAQVYNRDLSASEILQNYNSIKSRFNL